MENRFNLDPIRYITRAGLPAMLAITSFAIASCGNEAPPTSGNEVPQNNGPGISEVLEKGQRDAEVIADNARRDLDADDDSDGASNILDPYPDDSSPRDWDLDGIPNLTDARPYYADEAPGAGTGGDKPGAPANNPIPGNTDAQRSNSGCSGDRDCDGAPDSRDPYPDIPDNADNRTQPVDTDNDTDNDGILNQYDPHPNDDDHDNDGIIDGNDPDPNHRNDSLNEYEDGDPYVNDIDQDGDGVEDKYDSDPRDKYEN